MKTFNQRMKAAAILAGLLIALPTVGLADKPADKKGPSDKSKAVTAACLEADGSAHVYSCKALSNVVLWCGEAPAGVYIKYDDIVGDAGEELYEATFDCGVDADGVAISGPITMVAIKSGSQKNAKHFPDDYTPVEDAPSGSGLFLGDIAACPLESIPAPGDCKVAEVAEPPTF